MQWRRLVFTAAVVATTALFLYAVSAESGEHPHDESVPHSEEGEEGTTVLGISLESPLTIGVAVVLSLLVAALPWVAVPRWAWILAAAFLVGFAALDALELRHQGGLLATIAIVLAALHVGLAVACLAWAKAKPPTSETSLQ